MKGVVLYLNKLKFYFSLEYIVAIFCLNTLLSMSPYYII